MCARRRCATALVSMTAVSCLHAATPSARSIIDRAIRAAGEARAIAAIKSTRLEGAILRRNDGRTGVFLELTTVADRWLEEITLGQEVIREGWNGASLWRKTSAGLTTLTGDDALLAEAVAKSRGGRLSRSSGARGRLAGQESVDGSPAFRVEFLEGAVRHAVFIDTQTGLIVRETFQAGELSEAIRYREYQPVDGVMEPRAMEIRRGSDDWVISDIHVTHNRAMEAAVFDYPSSVAEPVADVARLLKEVENNQRTVDQILENYTYNKTEQEGEHTREYEVLYIRGNEIQKLVRRDRAAVTGAEREKEEERVRKLITRYSAKPKAPQREDRESDELHIALFLRASRFSHPRREQFRGQEMVVFDIEPNLGRQPQSLQEKLIQKLSGVMWVDSRTHQVARLEAHLSDTVKVAGGLASFERGSSAVFEQTLVNDEVWLPAYVEEDVLGRYLLVKGYQERLVIRYGNYQKFHVETTTEVLAPKPK